VVRPHGTGYQIVAGERRWRRGATARGCTKCPSSCATSTNTETLEVRAGREHPAPRTLTRSKKAEAYHRLIEDFGHTQEALGKLVNKSRVISPICCGCSSYFGRAGAASSRVCSPWAMRGR